MQTSLNFEKIQGKRSRLFNIIVMNRLLLC